MSNLHAKHVNPVIIDATVTYYSSRIWIILACHLVFEVENEKLWEGNNEKLQHNIMTCH